MNNLIHTAVVTLFAASAAQAQQAVQWKVSDGGNGHWYQVATTPRTFFQARDWAVDNGGSLVLIDSSQENQFLFQLVLSTTGSWNGAGPFFGLFQDPSNPSFSEPNGGWIWVDGTPRSGRFDSFCGGQPDNSWGGQSLAVYWAPSGSPQSCWDDDIAWTDLTTFTGTHLIEWSADCNNDGIVDYGQCYDGTLRDYNGNNVPDCCETGEACVVGNYPVQWRLEDGGNGHWYQLRYTSDHRWETAKIEAQLLGGHLATPTSPAENQRVYLVAQSPTFEGPYFGGFKNDSGECEWVTGERFVFSNWGGGEPNGGLSERFLHFKYGPVWNDAGSPYAPGYLVEWSADCNEDSIVDYGQVLTGQLADLDSNGIPDICQQPTCRDADIYRDFNVNGADLGIMLSQWGPNTPLTESDLNNDGVVNGADLGILLGFWGSCP